MSASRVWRRAVSDLAAEHGCLVSVTAGGHLKLSHPTGWFTFCPGTSGDRRALSNLRSDLRRKAAGVYR